MKLIAQDAPQGKRLSSSRAAIHAELIADNTCSALGMTVRGPAPLLALCRLLVEAGHDPATPLEAWRAGGGPCLRIRSIGAGARLRVSTHGGGFERLPGSAGACTAASPVRKNAAPPCPPAGRPERASEATVP
jgi:hypothetical protein